MIANIFQPLIDFFEQILLWFHDVGLSWGWSIIAMTVVVRAALLPLTFKQFKSMQALASHAPEMKKLQDRYKHDKERLNQEMMKFYRENKINPFASCLPLLAQLPVFLSLFYMLQKDLRVDICRRSTRRDANPSRAVPAATLVLVHPGPDRQGHRLGPDHADRPLRRLAAGFDAADVDDDGPDAADDLPGAAVLLRHLHHQLPGRPARLLDHHQPVDDRAAGDHPEAPRADATTGPGGDGTRRSVRRPRRRTGRPAPAAAGGGTATRPRASRAARRRHRRGARRSARDGGDERRLRPHRGAARRG